MAFPIALVSMPWALVDRPSIQLATLKAYLENRFGDSVDIQAFHPYLEVADQLGVATYLKVAERSWMGESLYAPLVFPEVRERAEKLFHTQVKRKDRRGLSYPQLLERIVAAHRKGDWVARLARFRVVGFSVCFAQLMSSLYLAREIKKALPEVRIVFGGSLVCGSLGRSLLAAFDAVDLVVSGEGEKPFADLVGGFLRRDRPEPGMIPGVYRRDARGRVVGDGYQQVVPLDSLPLPDYHDFFSEVSGYRGLKQTIFQLPVETSRGCWWHRASATEPLKACRFCNLNLQWHGYRHKSTRRTVAEIHRLVERHQSLRVVLVDNSLHPPMVEPLFDGLRSLGLGLHLFAELRVPLRCRQFLVMRQAGLQQVQIGIEALSAGMLRKLHKGTRVIDNIAAMKWCEQFGIDNLSNLLMEFPGSDLQDVTETLDALDYVLPYQPLRGVRFWLGKGSPVEMCPGDYGLAAVRNHRWYQALLPADRLERLQLLVKQYRGDQGVQRRLWRPVWQRLQHWRRHYREIKNRHGREPILGYSDGGTFLIVRRRSAAGRFPAAFRMKGRSREIYLSCLEPRSFAYLQHRFDSYRADQLEAFLNDLVAKRIMFWDGRSYLSLAVDEDVRRFCEDAAKKMCRES